MGDRGPRGGPAVTGHDHALGVAQGDDGGAVGDLERGVGMLDRNRLEPQPAEQLAEVGAGVGAGGEEGEAHVETEATASPR